ncbi:MAG: hypothetical protein CFH22_00537 [Alphaproteobacteria bacterium MarineAlpha5_Bin12]|nr:MAG: hypothetical protein CFH22_00537 [Alphaproteobacteria bacterium MarineAlpha5_Bin12]|tara:strand:+ start:20958 stop:22652 length:1695 start_codon:yes stop_codon:yes gene_type:complete
MKDIGKQINWYGWIYFNKTIPFISPLIIKFRQRKLRVISRGYSKIFNKEFLKNKNIKNLTVIEKEFRNKVFSEVDNYYSPIIFNNGLNFAKLICKHYFLKIIYVRKAYYPALNNEILYFFGKNKSKIIYPLPRIYRNFLKDYGIKFNDFFSDIYWYLFITFFYFIGLVVGLKNIFFSIFFCFIKPNLNSKKNYVYFNSLTLNCLPKDNRLNPNIINWYIDDNIKTQNNYICHNLKYSKNIYLENNIISYKKKIQYLNEFKGLIKFSFWFLKASFICLIDIFSGKWWHPLLFYESVNASMIRFQNSSNIPSKYFFNNSNFTYRPMWTYEAEKKSKIIMAFYSTNLRELKLKNIENPLPHYYIKESTWPYLYVWDLYDKKYFEKNIDLKTNIEIKGYIPFENGKKFDKEKSLKNLSVFDVQPTRDIFYKTIPEKYHDYYKFDNIINFLKVILSLTKFDIKIYIKRKRNIGSLAHPYYRNFIKIMEKNNQIEFVDSEVSAYDMIKKSRAVISIPFTSTAHIANKLNIPSIYFDPSGLIYDNDEALHNIKLINNLKSLEDWIKETFKP